MQYDGDLQLPARFLVAPPVIDRTMGEYLVAAQRRTLAVSETQKFGHVTYFWNGNKSGLLDEQVERYVEIPSDRVSFDQAPAMQAARITDVVIEALDSAAPPDLIRLNWANGDMVGHTGDLAATITAMEVVDQEVGRLLQAAQAVGAVVLVTADHGNADDMWMRDKAGRPRQASDGDVLPRTSHTLAPVPFTLFDPRPSPPWKLRGDLPQAGLAQRRRDGALPWGSRRRPTWRSRSSSRRRIGRWARRAPKSRCKFHPLRVSRCPSSRGPRVVG